MCGGRLTADRDEWRKECRDFGSIRYGNSASCQDEQRQRVRRHEELLKEANEDQNIAGARISLADMMMGRADFKSGESYDRNGLSAEMLECLPLVLVWRLGELFNHQYSQPFEDEPSSWEVIPATGIPKEGK